MAITEAYFSQVKNVGEIFSALLNAQAPERFSQKFLYDLGFTSVNDRPFVSVLKSLAFIDESGAPTQRYYDYLDEENSSRILAQGIREAYGDLFAVNQKAYDLTSEQVKGKLKSLSQGKKSESVLKKMASTFSALCSLADFTGMPKSMEKGDTHKHDGDSERIVRIPSEPGFSQKEISLTYSINIELPSTRDQLVYDAIFRAIRENLL